MTPPIFPQKFIHPEIEPANSPPKLIAQAQEALKVNPSDPSDKDSHITFCIGSAVLVAIYKAREQIIIPAEPHKVRIQYCEAPLAIALSQK